MMTDPSDFGRFLEAQESAFQRALAEIRSGEKRSHWMWFIFPQLAGLGRSAAAQHYALRSLEEARAYLAHPILGSRLRSCVEALLDLDGRSADKIFGFPDGLKLRSSATLFAQVAAGKDSIFDRLLEKYFDGKPDSETLRLLSRK